ncbi:MAG TPA: fasciclin domain-containing protein [Candidatus Paceibacterota bacterium]|nr:fasciclin domain-containing protein [Candidatus Paceibacterota bacterium]
MKGNTGVWIGVVGIVLVALLAWWLVATAPKVPSDTGIYSNATSTGSTSGTTSGGSQATQGVPRATRSNASVAAIAQSISGASTFASWFSSTGVAAEVTGKGPYTIFVPTNGSISQLPTGTFTGLSAAQKKRFVEYHVIVGKALDADALVAGQEQALSKDMLNVAYGSNKIPMINSSIIIAAYQGNNGIVYLIDQPLIPPHQTQP